MSYIYLIIMSIIIRQKIQPKNTLAILKGATNSIYKTRKLEYSFLSDSWVVQHLDRTFS